MKTLIIFLLLFLSITVKAQKNDVLDEKYGFRDAKFEMSFNSFKNLVKVEKNLYKRTTEDLKLGNYKLDAVYYGFYKGQLYMILIDTKGDENSTGVLNVFQQAYGGGHSWLGEKVFMGYEQNSITGDATITIVCLKLMNLKEAEKKQADSAAAKKL